MNETLEGLKDNVDLGGKEINDVGDDDDGPPDGPSGGGGGDQDDEDRPPPDPGEDPDLADISLSEAEGEKIEDINERDALDAIGDSILRAEEDAVKGADLPPLPPPAHPPGASDEGRRPF